jgi:hypothetical protein
MKVVRGMPDAIITCLPHAGRKKGGSKAAFFKKFYINVMPASLV